MSSTASEEQRNVFLHYKREISELEKGKTKTIILPHVTDEHGNRMFELVQPKVVFEFSNIDHIEVVGDVIVGSAGISKQEEINNGNN